MIKVIFWIVFFCILGATLVLLFIFGYPRKICARIPNEDDLFNDEVAQAFQKMTDFLPFRMLHNSVIKTIKKLNPSGDLVDIGCGTGNILIKIAKNLPSLNLKGIDISNEVLDLAKQRVIDNGVETNIEFKIGTAENLPLPDHSVDYVISTLSLHHWLEPQKVIEEIYRVLKADGTFIIFDFRRDARRFFHSFFRFVTKVVVPKPLKRVKEPLGSLLAAYTPDEILQIISQTSFKKAKIKPLIAWMYISNKKLR